MKNFLPLLLLLVVAGLSAQTPEPQRPASVMTSELVYLGQTPPLRELLSVPATTADKKAAIKANRPPRNFVGRGVPPITAANPEPQTMGYDPVRQKDFRNTDRSVNGDITFNTNIEGLFTGRAPHDPSGDIGLNHYIEAVNVTTFRIYNRDGTPASGPINANTLWSEVNRSSAGDPIVLYDQEAQRWIITEFPPGNELLMAVSATSDPFGSWDAYVFGTPTFPDYPKWSIWPNAIMVTTNETGPREQTVYAIDRAALLDNDGGNLTVQRIGVDGIGGNPPGFYVGTPVDWSGMAPPVAGAKPMILRQNDDAWGDVATDQIDVIEFDIDFDDAANTTFTVQSLDCAPYDSNPCSESGPGFGCIPQLDDNAIDGLPYVIMNQVHYQNFGTHESIVLNFITDGTAGDKVSGIRWMELRRETDGNAPDLGWTVYQEGTFAPDDGVDRFMGAIAQDAQGNIALAYTTSSANEHPSLKVTGRFATDPLGEMTQLETTIVEGTGTITGGNRYGDYAQMSVDPFNGRTFWFVSEYGKANGVTTRIAGFDLKKDTNDLSARVLISPERILAGVEGPSVVTVEIRNVGIDAQTGFQVGYSVDGGAAVIEDVTGVTLEPDSAYVHTFDATVDLSALGVYQLKAWSDLDIDEFRPNDTIRSTVRTLAESDVAVVDLEAPTAVCSSVAGLFVTLRNTSGRLLTNTVITIELNGEVVKTQNWTGNLDPTEEARVLVILSGLEDGDFEVAATATLPNGFADEQPDNNVFTANMSVLSDGDVFDFALQLDNFPEETSWELVDEEGTVIFSGDNYSTGFQLVEEEFCLDPDGCYTLRLFDSFGDGIFGNGGFTITNENGEIVVAEDGTFSGLQTGEFCASGVCLLQVDGDITDASGENEADGVIMLTLDNTNGGEFSISFDGGPASNQTVFTNLLPGDYTVLVSNGDGCDVEQVLTVGFCTLAATATAVDSSIVVTVDAGVEPYEYSLDGENFQTGNTFPDLINDTYTVTIRDAQGCDVVVEVIVDDPNDVFTATTGQTVTIFPNPTDGVFKVEMTNAPHRGTLLPIEIYDAAGRVIQYGRLVRYDATYYGHFSLVNHPVGTYYLRVVDGEINRLLRIVKN